MTPQQKERVKHSWISVVPIADMAAELFYARLFKLDPSVKPMFKGDMKEQGEKLMKTIGFAVSALDDVDPLIDTLKEMGAKHKSYGVINSDYETVATALLWALEQSLGDAFTDEVKIAWGAAYVVLANIMKLGAAESEIVV